MGGTTKRVRRPNFEISVGEAKGGNTIFDSDLVGGGLLEETIEALTRALRPNFFMMLSMIFWLNYIILTGSNRVNEAVTLPTAQS